MFERFRRGTAAELGKFSCYGKLPFDREFLRYQLDSDEGRWIVDWVDSAHQVIVSRGGWSPSESSLELRVVLSRGGGRSAVVAVIRPSRDGGNRSYPVCTFAVLEGRTVRDRWHLAPLWVAPLWEGMNRQLLDASIPDRQAFAAALAEIACVPENADAVGARFEEAAHDRLDSPWRALSGANAESVRNSALTLVQLGAAHAASRGPSAGAALRFPVLPSQAPGAAFGPGMQTALWIRLFSFVSDSTGPWPGVVEIHERGNGTAQGGCIFGREPTADDLAYLLASVGDPAIDDLNQTWDRELSSERAQKLLAGLLDENARCLADLWENR